MKRVLALLLLITACTPTPETTLDQTFRHEYADVDGIRMHYVKGGSGTPVVLIHGWPQTWYGWWPIMPALAERHTVYAIDLPGLGDSTGTPKSYDKATLARYVHALTKTSASRPSSATTWAPPWPSSTPASSPPTPASSATSTCRCRDRRSTRERTGT
jgi:hypothetical protein